MSTIIKDAYLSNRDKNLAIVQAIDIASINSTALHALRRLGLGQKVDIHNSLDSHNIVKAGKQAESLGLITMDKSPKGRKVTLHLTMLGLLFIPLLKAYDDNRQAIKAKEEQQRIQAYNLSQAAPKMLSAIRFVLADLNSQLDYEARIILESAIKF